MPLKISRLAQAADGAGSASNREDAGVAENQPRGIRHLRHWLGTGLGLGLMMWGAVARGQAPAGTAPAAKEDSYTGPTLNTSFDGSADSDSQVYDWTTSAGYIFNKHFSASMGVPIVFARGTTATGTTVSSSGIGNVYAQGQLAFRNPGLNYGAALTVSAPTGDSSKGRSSGRLTFDVTNQVAREFGRFTPFLSAGAGNSLLDSRYWHRPYYTLGAVAHFEGGTSIDLGHSLTVSGSLYDVAPWGTQKVYSRIVTKANGGPGGASKHGRVFQNNALTTGGAELDRDNGYNVDVDFSPLKYVDFDLGYSHSVHFQLDTISFGIGFNLTPLLHRRRGG